MTKIKKWVRSQAIYQATNMAGVLPELRLKDDVFYLNSSAGQITYKPKTVKDLTRFRDKYVNRFEMLIKETKSGINTNVQVFDLYHELRGDAKVKWRANAHTRMKAALHVFRIR